MSKLRLLLACSMLSSMPIATSSKFPRPVGGPNWTPGALQRRYEDEELGMSRFVRPEEAGIGGIFKWRWTDFRVNEVTSQGAIVRLVDGETLPELPWPLLDTLDDVLFHLERALPEDLWHKLKAAWPKRETWSGTVDRVFRSQERIQVCSVKLKSDEEVEAMSRAVLGYSWKRSPVKCTLKSENCNVKVYIRRREGRQDSRVLACTMTKCGWDTLTIIRELSSLLCVPPDSITYAGVKDKTAITEQLLSFAGVSPRRLLSLNNSTRIAGIRLGDLRYERQAIKIGNHSGNSFTLLLRHLTQKPEMIKNSVLNLASSGFINYFGHQRFGDGGGSGLPPIEVGKLLLSGKWSEVIKTMMNPNCVRSDSERQAKMAFMQSRRQDALRILPRSCHDERIALQNLLKGCSDGQTCRFLPHRTLFMCAYWSHVWNRVASYRIEKYGNRLAIGDLVRYTTSEQDDGDFHLLHPNDFSISSSEAIHVVQEADIQEEKFSVFDVVLPLPGKGVTMIWPENEAGNFVKNLLEQDGLLNAVLNPFAPSGYCVLRNLIMRPRNLKFKLLRYNNGSDGIICGHHLETGEVSYFGTTRKKSNKVEERSWLAVQLRFQLPSNVFATMALRELCKVHGGIVEQYKRRKDAEEVEAKVSKKVKKERLEKIWRRLEKKGFKEDWRTKLADQLASWRVNYFHGRPLSGENLDDDDRI